MAFLQLAQKATSAICGCTRLSALVSRPDGNCAQAETELPPFPIYTVKSVRLVIISTRSAHVLRYQHVEQDQRLEIGPGVLCRVGCPAAHGVQIRVHQRPHPGHQRGHSSGPLDPVVPHFEAQTFLAVSLVRNASRPVRRNIYMATVRIRIPSDARPCPHSKQELN